MSPDLIANTIVIGLYVLVVAGFAVGFTWAYLATGDHVPRVVLAAAVLWDNATLAVRQVRS